MPSPRRAERPERADDALALRTTGASGCLMTSFKEIVAGPIPIEARQGATRHGETCGHRRSSASAQSSVSSVWHEVHGLGTP